MQVPPDEQIGVRLLELVKEPVSHDGHLGDIQKCQVRAILQETANSELTNALALDQFDMLQVRHGLRDLRQRRVSKRCIGKFEGKAAWKARLDCLIANSDLGIGQGAASIIIDIVASRHIQRLQIEAEA